MPLDPDLPPLSPHRQCYHARAVAKPDELGWVTLRTAASTFYIVNNVTMVEATVVIAIKVANVLAHRDGRLSLKNACASEF